MIRDRPLLGFAEYAALFFDARYDALRRIDEFLKVTSWALRRIAMIMTSSTRFAIRAPVSPVVSAATRPRSTSDAISVLHICTSRIFRGLF